MWPDARSRAKYFELVHGSRLARDIGNSPFVVSSIHDQMTARPRFQYTESAELSITRINRLLRPLRNKCGILVSATSRSSGLVAPITYGSSLSLETRVPPSLDVLRDPKLVVSRAHQESRSLDALARQIYAVTNAYRNVVQAALPNDVPTSRRQVLALTDICAASVGRNIQAEVARCVATLEEPDEAEETALVDELYESVPARFRRCAASFCYIVTPAISCPQVDPRCARDVRNCRHLP